MKKLLSIALFAISNEFSSTVFRFLEGTFIRNVDQFGQLQIDDGNKLAITPSFKGLDKTLEVESVREVLLDSPTYDRLMLAIPRGIIRGKYMRIGELCLNIAEEGVGNNLIHDGILQITRVSHGNNKGKLIGAPKSKLIL